MHRDVDVLALVVAQLGDQRAGGRDSGVDSALIAGLLAVRLQWRHFPRIGTGAVEVGQPALPTTASDPQPRGRDTDPSAHKA